MFIRRLSLGREIGHSHVKLFLRHSKGSVRSGRVQVVSHCENSGLGLVRLLVARSFFVTFDPAGETDTRVRRECKKTAQPQCQVTRELSFRPLSPQSCGRRL